MSNIDELMSMLGARGIEHELYRNYIVPGYDIVSWTMPDGRRASYCEDERGTSVCMQATPEQAVAATLDDGKCAAYREAAFELYRVLDSMCQADEIECEGCKLVGEGLPCRLTEIDRILNGGKAVSR